MALNEGQQEALNIAVARYNAGQPYTVLAGAAGTGKSFLVKYIISALGLDLERDVVYATPTGKAAQVLKKRGAPNVMTLHKLLYETYRGSDGEFHFYPRPFLEEKPQIIVVDEVSMVDPRIWERLLSHGVPVLAMGDNHQLPPIFPDHSDGVLANPHIILTEIMRQAQGNEIIDLATHVRRGGSINTYKSRDEQVKILSANEIGASHYKWADQILCATNDTRRIGNATKREILGFDPNKPAIEDRVTSLKNHWDFVSVNKEPLINGSIGHILDYDVQRIYLPRYIYEGPYNLMTADIETEDGDIFQNVRIDYNCLMTGVPTLNPYQQMQLIKNKRWRGEAPFEMNFSYFCTVHRAQGDEWDKVMVFEERFPFETDIHRRWLYTAITRAASRCVIVKK